MQLFKFAGVRKVPEGFRKLVRKLTRIFHFRRSSGRFRKVSGRLSGSLFSFCSCGCSSGRLPEACPEACQTASISCIPEASGRFPEVVPEGYKTLNISLGLVSQTSLRVALLTLKSIWLANQLGSFSCHARKQVKFPEAFRKVAGRFPEAYK